MTETQDILLWSAVLIIFALGVVLSISMLTDILQYRSLQRRLREEQRRREEERAR